MRKPKLYIFDMDGVLVHFYPKHRLQKLAELSGLTEDYIHKTIFASEFENQAEAGKHANGQAYLNAFNKKLGSSFSIDEWNSARALAMEENHTVLDLVEKISRTHNIAMLTNNGPLLIEYLSVLAPRAAEIFANSAHATCQFQARKPDIVVYQNIAAHYAHKVSDCLMIDDKPENIAGALKAGMQGLIFTGVESLSAQIDI